jgi:hypothetical protein
MCAYPTKAGTWPADLPTFKDTPAMSPREFIVFYAWQNDTSPRENRYLIRTALGVAAKRITADTSLGVHVRIDSDTQGVLGQPPVAATILAKIDECDVFVPDFTFIAKTSRRKNKDGSRTKSKFVPNANVMLEYGYALQRLSYGVMIPVMNTIYGPPEELPFDLGHLRFPLQYRLEADGTASLRRAAAKRLADELERILRDMIAAAQPKTTTPFPKAASTYEPAFFFKRGETLAQFGQYESECEYYSFAASAAAFLRLFPTGARENIGRAKLWPFFEQRRVPMMSRLIGGLAAQNAYGSIIIDPIAHSEISALTQAFPTGELWGVTSKCFGNFTPRALFEDPAPFNVVAMLDFENIFQKALRDFVAFATERLQMVPPFTVIAGASGLKDYSLAFPSREYNGREYARLHQNNFEKTYDLPRLEGSDLDAVLLDFFEGFWDLAGCSRAESLTDENIKARGLLPRHAPR